MTTSVFDLFKIGIGPSSSHTTGPMVAAKRFRETLPRHTVRAQVELFGSLAWTGEGHGTNKAICLGLLGEEPATVDPDRVDMLVGRLAKERSFRAPGGRRIRFDPQADLLFDREHNLPLHTNAMRFSALGEADEVLLKKVYYSIGGGFVREEGEPSEQPVDVPHPFASSAQLLRVCSDEGLSIAALQFANESALRSPDRVINQLDAIRDAMFASIERGLRNDGLLPGRLNVKRRAKALLKKLETRKLSNTGRPHDVMDWVSTYAIAVNEENAAGGRIVTAPTNGAAGIVPAVLRYFRDFCMDYSDEGARSFLLTAAAIGSLIKRNSSISGAEVGCQGEVGSAASMAAAGLAAALGASPGQVENAAEIAMEHHLGLTCDPIGGLVQIPCIERNAFGANKAIAAASLALNGDGTHRVSLDEVIETMRQTGADMQSKYKETSQGGLAVNVAEC